VVSIIAAFTDYRHWMSTMSENNKNRKTGFGAISSSVTNYRRYVGISGAVALILGILDIAKS